MHALKQAQRTAGAPRDGRHLVGGVGKTWGGLVIVLHTIAVFCAERDAHAGPRSFEACLQRTGRIRYR
ncbi:MAG TPA: hypothetical protein VE268_06980 [Herpetosiphonaceae bacterium]|nr:hypothetical protein [Herpetosiphonaceae bacterium]